MLWHPDPWNEGLEGPNMQPIIMSYNNAINLISYNSHLFSTVSDVKEKIRIYSYDINDQNIRAPRLCIWTYIFSNIKNLTDSKSAHEEWDWFGYSRFYTIKSVIEVCCSNTRFGAWKAHKCCGPLGHLGFKFHLPFWKHLTQDQGTAWIGLR